MGLDSFTFSLDWLKHAFLVLVTVIMLFLVVKAVSGDIFWMRYQAKDLGLLLSASHGAPGDITIDYNKLSWRDHFDYNVTPGGLLIRKTKHSQWRVRQKFYTTINGPGVTPALVIDPAGLRLKKEGNNIMVAADSPALPGCPQLKDPPRDSVLIDIEGNSPLITPQLKRELKKWVAASLKQKPRLSLTFNINLDANAETISISPRGDREIAGSLVCKLSQNLNSFPVETKAASSPAAGSGSSLNELEITITHPFLPGFDDTILASAIMKSLEAFP